jgi:hypothetical protein
MDDLQKIEPVSLEYLACSEHREVFRDGDELVPSTDGLMRIHLRFPGGRPFTAHVTQEVFREFFLPRILSSRVITHVEGVGDGPDREEAEQIREMLDLASADPDFRIFIGPRP